jgi:phage host-nuclease inhibitor protein Gam
MSIIKERITQDLGQVKEKGGARTQKIREIVKAAVGDAVSEIKDGSVEIRTIAQDAVTAVMEHFQSKGNDAKNEVMAAMEGVVSGVSSKQDNTTNQPMDEKQVLDAVDGALVAVEKNQQKTPFSFMSIILGLFNILRKRFAKNLQKESVFLQELLGKWDVKLTEKHGDRYTQVKQRWETAQASYNETKTKIANGETSPVNQYQTEVQDKAAKAGATVAQTEVVIRKQLKTLLETTASKL